MADRPTNRPRRAFGADEPTPDTGAGLEGRFTEDEARPIFREDAADADAATVRTPGDADPATPDKPGTPAEAAASDRAEGEDATAAPRTKRLNFTPATRPAEDDATTLLPRTTGRPETAPLGLSGDRSDDEDLDERPRRLGRRGRLAVLVGAVAAVVVVGIAIGTAVIGVRDQPGAGGDPGPSSSAPVTPSATALLDDTSMLSVEGAQLIAGNRTWTAGSTVRGPVPDGSGAACLGSDPLEGAPTAQQTITRTLTADGSGAQSAVHVAQAYASVEDATQAFATTSRALGSCAVAGDWLFTGRVVEGVGDEATAVAVHSTVGGERTQHWVVASRTGRVLDVVDASTPGKTALNVNDVTKAVASVVTGQCGPAGGACATTVSTKDGPPPAGGDEPGFLATGDLPPVGSVTAPWVGTPVQAPSEDFSGSQCESVNWSTTAATAKSSRVYLLQDVPGIFGLNEIVLTVKDADTASKLAEKVRSDWSSCKERKLTATVDSPTKVTGVAAEGAAVTGWTTEVEQKAGGTTTRFRVGIASSGDKVAFVFLNPQKGLDVDGDDWNTVAVRAVQRATQQQ
ncbi:hypothetical protein [Microlunatus antarcticus]|uniref:Uncharacterized protein n=1 Tax=Microlunatus antarcticus TaxID=53388 RepID=A0A7W5JSP4_9ACTN|nr:hypothetical protein [Microlunatus antarcticus]MBB3325629.1 hypothetical protein [Microlunatus antarcticus]